MPVTTGLSPMCLMNTYADFTSLPFVLFQPPRPTVYIPVALTAPVLAASHMPMHLHIVAEDTAATTAAAIAIVTRIAITVPQSHFCLTVFPVVVAATVSCIPLLLPHLWLF